MLCACVQAAVDRMLAAPARSTSADAQQQHLKLLVEVYKRTHLLAEQLQVHPLSQCSRDMTQQPWGVSTHVLMYPQEAIYLCSCEKSLECCSGGPHSACILSHIAIARAHTVYRCSFLLICPALTEASATACMHLLPHANESTARHEQGGWVQEVVGEGNDVLQMSEGVFVEHLADYPEMELSWLQQLYENCTPEAAVAGATLNNVMNSITSLSGLTKKVRRVLLHTVVWSMLVPLISSWQKYFVWHDALLIDLARPLLALLLKSSSPHIT